jgi:hypothetical protein
MQGRGPRVHPWCAVGLFAQDTVGLNDRFQQIGHASSFRLVVASRPR